MEDQETTPPTHHSDKNKDIINENTPEEPYDPSQPRLGRRESEPHSWEITYLHNVLEANFPESRVMWDLHHYFAVNGEEYDIRFDISFFPNFTLPVRLPSYRAADYDNRIPTLTINILSKSTFRSDIGETVDMCKRVKVPVYIVFASHPIGSNLYRPPFLRAYLLQGSGKYDILETGTIALREGDPYSKMDGTAFLDLSPYVSFKVGIMELKAKYIRNETLYRLILLDSKTQQILFTQSEKNQQCIDQEKTRADQEKTRADQLKKTVDRYKKKYGDLT